MSKATKVTFTDADEIVHPVTVEAGGEVATVAIDCPTCHHPMRLIEAGRRGGTWTCDHCPPDSPA